MNFREMFGVSMVALSFIMLTRVVTGWWAQPGEQTRFTAPAQYTELKPLNVELNFPTSADSKQYHVDTISTDYGRMNFSTAGGTLSDFTFVRTQEGRLQEFPVIVNASNVDRQQTPFLVAFDTETPYDYRHVSTTETEQTHVLQYRVDTASGSIDKIFTVYKHKPQIDVALTIDPKKEVTARLVWPSPMFTPVDNECALGSVVFDKRGSYSTTLENKIDYKEGYIRPQIFGSQDKYFLFTLVQDADNFGQRAYYKSVDTTLISLVESAPITEKTTWNISFYCGPKDPVAINAVDNRLDKTLNYGMFSFLTKPLLALMGTINKYVNNYGFTIIIMTLLLKLLLLPFTLSGDKKMRKMQDYAQKMDYLKRKYKDNPEALKQAQMEMLQTNGMPLSGCLAPLIQMPFFFALSGGLTNSLELYGAPFLWIKDLSMADPYYILPFLVTVSMLFGGIMQAQGGGARQRMVGIGAGLLLGAISSTWAAGSVLYIAANLGLHAIQANVQKMFKL